MNSINKICKGVLKITVSEFNEIEEIAQSQQDYVHPLKIATQIHINKLGRHNKAVLEKLKELQDLLGEQE